jgi:hypothetical protein
VFSQGNQGMKALLRQFNTKNRASQKARFSANVLPGCSALAGFEPGLRFVDHINAAFTAYNAAITVPVLERAERVLDLHGLSPVPAARASAFCCGCREPENRVQNSEFMVGTTGFEPVTPSMSTKCSTAELSAHEYRRNICAPTKWGAESRAGSAVYKRSRRGDQGLLAIDDFGLRSCDKES